MKLWLMGWVLVLLFGLGFGLVMGLELDTGHHRQYRSLEPRKKKK